MAVGSSGVASAKPKTVEENAFFNMLDFVRDTKKYEARYAEMIAERERFEQAAKEYNEAAARAGKANQIDAYLEKARISAEQADTRAQTALGAAKAQAEAIVSEAKTAAEELSAEAKRLNAEARKRQQAVRKREESVSDRESRINTLTTKAQQQMDQANIIRVRAETAITRMKEAIHGTQ